MLLIQNNLYRLEVCHHAKTLRFLVSDKDHAYSEKIGEVQIMASSLLSGDRIEGKDAKNKFNLCKGAFNNYMYKGGGALCVEMGFYADISWESRCNIEINV